MTFSFCFVEHQGVGPYPVGNDPFWVSASILSGKEHTCILKVSIYFMLFVIYLCIDYKDNLYIEMLYRNWNIINKRKKQTKYNQRH